MTAELTVLQAGVFTTLQDLGRTGMQALGVPISGALDPFSMRLANALVGNALETGCLEIRLAGPKLQVGAETVRVALVGADCVIETDDPQIGSVQSGRSATLTRGTTLRVGALKGGATAYLAVSGGFDVKPVFGSCATYQQAGLGGFEGRAIHEGDHLPLCLENAPEAPDLTAPPKFGGRDLGPIRVVLGPQADYFSSAAIEAFLNTSYTVSPKSNRMGMQLDGPVIDHLSGFNIPSDGVVAGAIQVPGHGLPIVLLADCQTTGGYPKIATVISSDLPRLAHAMPGSELKFAAVNVGQAENIRRQVENELLAKIANLRPADGSDFLSKLYTENLISGVFGFEF